MGNSVGSNSSSALTQAQKDLIVGCLLGDGRLERRTKKQTARLRIHHSERQVAYVQWKFKKLQSIVSSPPRKIMCWYDAARGHYHYSYYFHTRATSELGKLSALFYRDGRKTIPQNIRVLLSPLTTAVWIMDDGCNTGGSTTISAHCFSCNEQNALIDVLKSRYKIFPSRCRDRQQFKIYIGKRDTEILRRIIAPYIIAEMRYKIAP